MYNLDMDSIVEASDRYENNFLARLFIEVTKLGVHLMSLVWEV